MSDPIRKWSKDMNRHFTEEDIKMANKHKKTSSSSYTIKKMQTKPTARYFCTPDRMTNMKNSNNNKCIVQECTETGSLQSCLC